LYNSLTLFVILAQRIGKYFPVCSNTISELSTFSTSKEYSLPIIGIKNEKKGKAKQKTYDTS
jgi:hypothetical protein